MRELRVETTEIPGLLVIRLGLKPNDDGWFKEDWHRAKMTALGVPDFRPVQHNVTHVVSRGITRGFLAEPWDRLVSVVRGRAMGAWVDLRAGRGFGRTHTCDLNPGTAVYVPRGVGTAHQALEDDTTFSYLLEHHWTPEARRRYSSVDAFDPALGITWPIGRERALVAHRDTLHPLLADATPMEQHRTLVVGIDTGLGRAVLSAQPGAVGLTAAQLGPDAVSRVDLSAYDTIVNAHGHAATGFPSASLGRDSWSAAADRAQVLTEIARRHNLRYVHISSDCIFDRTAPSHPDDEPLSLRDAHGQALAAGEILAASVPRHLIVRTGWVVGSAEGFVADVSAAARHGSRLQVVGDRHGRLTFSDQLVSAITHLLDVSAPSGTYNLTGDGRAETWAEVARHIYSLNGADPDQVQSVTSTGEDMEGPAGSQGVVLDLARVKAAGFRPGDWWTLLADRVAPASATSGRPTIGEGISVAPVRPGMQRRAPYKVMFVCTANICRSAYAGVAAQHAAPTGVEFGSAGIRALVGRPMDTPIGQHLGERGDASAHRARQLTRDLTTDSDLLITMAAEHRRYILDEWPAQGRKVFVIGHVAREMARLPETVTLETLVDHLWQHRTLAEGDEVADPYGRGAAASATASRTIDAYLDVILAGFRTLLARSRPA